MRVLEKERELARLGTLNLLAMPLLRLSLGSIKALLRLYSHAPFRAKERELARIGTLNLLAFLVQKYKC